MCLVLPGTFTAGAGNNGYVRCVAWSCPKQGWDGFWRSTWRTRWEISGCTQSLKRWEKVNWEILAMGWGSTERDRCEDDLQDDPTGSRYRGWPRLRLKDNIRIRIWEIWTSQEKSHEQNGWPFPEMVHQQWQQQKKTKMKMKTKTMTLQGVCAPLGLALMRRRVTCLDFGL